jgi:hypothetical protein
MTTSDPSVVGKRSELDVERRVHLLGSAFEETTATGNEEGVAARCGRGSVVQFSVLYWGQ